MEQEQPKRRGRLGRLVGLAAIVGAGALWRQRQQQRDLDEELWGDPMDAPGTRATADAAEASEADGGVAEED